MNSRLRLFQLRRPVLGTVLVFGLPFIGVWTAMHLVTGSDSSLAAGIGGALAGMLLVGLLEARKPDPFPDDLDTETRVEVVQAVHDGAPVDRPAVARGVLTYLGRHPRYRRSGPWWLYLTVWLVASAVLVVLLDRSMADASGSTMIAVQIAVTVLVGIAVVSAWRQGRRARATERAARALLDERGPAA